MKGPKISPVPALLFFTLAAVSVGVLIHARKDHRMNAPKSSGCGCGCSGMAPTAAPAPLGAVVPRGITIGEPAPGMSVPVSSVQGGGLGLLDPGMNL
jgi:hypothetical protein